MHTVSSYLTEYTVATDFYHLAYSYDDNAFPAPYFEGSFSAGEGVPGGDWTALVTPVQVAPYGGIGLQLKLQSGALEFLAHTHPPSNIEDTFYAEFNGGPLTLRVEHEAGMLALSYSRDYLVTWTEVARFSPAEPVIEVAVVVRYDREDLPAGGLLTNVCLLQGLLTSAVEEVWLGEAGPAAVARAGREAPVVAPAVNTTSEPLVHAIVGAQFGDLDFDIGKSVRWVTWFTDNVFVLDINTGTPRYWIINWAQTFPTAKHTVTSINYFSAPAKFREEQWNQYRKAFGEPNEDEWILFIDGHEGFSVDNRSLPDDYASSPFMSFLWREIQRAQDLGESSAVFPFYVFLRSDNLTNITYPTDTGGVVPLPEQTLSVPYYLPYQGLRRLWNVAALRAPNFDWSQLDTPVAPSAGAKAQIISYGYAHWNLQDIEPPATSVEPISEENDDGWRMRQLLSRVRPIPGLPIGEWQHPGEHSVPVERPTFAPPPAWDLPVVTSTPDFQEYNVTTISGGVLHDVKRVGAAGTALDVPNDPKFRYLGAPATLAVPGIPSYANYFVQMPFKPVGASQFARFFWLVEWETDASVLEIRCKNVGVGTEFGIKVNGRWYSETLVPNTHSTNNRYVVKLVFPDARMRRIEYRGTGDVGFGGIWTNPGATVRKPPPITRKVAFIGDSITNGSNIAPAGGRGNLETYAPRLAHFLGIDEPCLMGIGGTGWVAGATNAQFGLDRLTEVLAMNPTAIYFAGSSNDSAQPLGTVQAAVAAGLARCAAVPEVYVIGSHLITHTALNAAIKTTTEAAGRVYYDYGILNPTDRTVIGTDSIHPTFEGHKRLADHLLGLIDPPVVDTGTDPAGLPGAWVAADVNNPNAYDPATGQLLPQPVAPDPSLLGIVTPLYDTVFRINMRDGVWYEDGESGNIPLKWDETLQDWVTEFDPALWNQYGLRAYSGEYVPPVAAPDTSEAYGEGAYGEGPYGQ